MLCLIISTGIVLLSGCSSEPTDSDIGTEQDTPEDKDSEEQELTIENILFTLTKEGYKETDEGYVISSFEEDVSSRRVVTAQGNNLFVTLSYNYGNNQNAEMIEFFKTQDEAVNVMVSGFLTRLAHEADAATASMEYTINIGGEQVVKDTMSLEDAEYYQSLAIE